MLVALEVGALLAFGVAAGIGGYTFAYAEGWSYLSDDPKACANCHIMRDQYDSWQHASHHGVATCNDCHVPHDLAGKWFAKSLNGYHHSAAFTLQNFDEPIRIKETNAEILQANCVRCHEVALSEMKVTEESGACARCHATVGHAAAR